MTDRSPTESPHCDSHPKDSLCLPHRENEGLSIGGARVSDLVARFGTPLYILDSQDIRSRAIAFVDTCCPNTIRPYYSMKANPNMQVIRLMRDLGIGIDVCSPGEVAAALHAGTDARRMSYTGVGLGDSDIASLVEQGVWVNLDSATEVHRWIEVAAGCPVGLRVNPNVRAGFHPHLQSGVWGGKFGVHPSELPELVQLLSGHGCAVRVLHAHIGSSIVDAEPFLAVADCLLALAKTVPTVTAINLGGGLAACFHPDDSPFPLPALVAELGKRKRRFLREAGRDIVFQLEPGEYLVSTAGYLLVSVLATKAFTHEGAARQAAIVDGGMNLYPAHSLYGSYLGIHVDRGADAGTFVPADVYGNTNHAGDTLALGRPLPPLAVGDTLVICNAGAYARCRSTQFNHRPRPATVWIRSDGDCNIIDAAEPVESLFSGQRIHE